MKMKIVIIDNYDSFTYNLAHLVKELGVEVTVFVTISFCSQSSTASIRLF